MGILDKVKKTDEKKPRAPRKTKAADAGVSASEAKPASKAVMSDAGRILIRPIVSEKTTMQEMQQVYTFEVARHATKVDVQRAIQAVYGVKPVAVRTVNVEGKRVRFGRTLGRRADWKKACVTLPKGKTISIHEGV